MGCGGSKEGPGGARSAASRKYLAAHAAGHGGDPGAPGFTGIDLYNSAPAGPLTAREYKARLVTSEGTQCVTLPRSGYTIRYAYVSQRGYYPDSPDKPNQDSFCVHTSFNGDPEQHLFGVFDGHGDAGTLSSQFARDKVPLNLLASAHFNTNPALAFHQAMVATNLQCHRSDFDDSMSGTTAIAVLIRGRSLLVANVGDSRAVLGERVPPGHGGGGGAGGFIARDLSIDQTPYRRDECERVKAAGARVLTLDQIEGLKDPSLEAWTTEEEDDGDPPRLWFPNGMYPGTAFTRSIGDAAAERIGVFAEPELEFRHLGPADTFLVIASDGVFEFISSQRVVDMVSKFDDPHEACLSVVAESYRLWLQYETRTDDITMIMLQLSGLETPPPGAVSSLARTRWARRPPARLRAAAAAAAAAWPRIPAVCPDVIPAGPGGRGAAGRSGGAGGRGRGGGGAAAAAAAAQQEEAAAAAAAAGQQPPAPAPAAPAAPAPATAAAAAAVPQVLGLACLRDAAEITKWFQSHNFRAPEDEPPADGDDAGAGARGAAAAAAAAAAGAGVWARQQAPAALDLGHITPAQHRMLEESVKHNFLFSHLSAADRLAAYKAMRRVEVEPGQVIIAQGERGDDFYVVEAGEFDVMVGEQQPAPAAAQPPPDPVSRRSMSSGGSMLLDNDLMADIAAVAVDERLTALQEEEELAAGGRSPSGSVMSGTTGGAPTLGGGGSELGLLGGQQTPWGELVHTYVAPPPTGPDAGGPHPTFGELALLYGKPRAATVVAQTPGVLWQLARHDFRAALQAARGDPDDQVLRTLRNCELLECMTNAQLLMLSDLLQPRIYQDGAFIIQQGETSDEFFIVAQGNVVAVVRPSGGAAPDGAAGAGAAGAGREVLKMGPGAFFGEKVLLGEHARPASMVARGRVLLLAGSRGTFEAAFGPLSALQADHAAWAAWLGRQRDLLARGKLLGPKHTQLLEAEFDPQSLQLRGCLWMLNEAAALAALGTPGGGGDLALTGRLYSVEVVERRGLGASVARARRVAASLPPCLFVPHTVAAWAAPRPRGGPAVVAGEALATVGVCTLAALLQGGPLDERSAAYVSAMALLGLSHLHRLGLMYRGLSAITLLVTEGGLVQLVDFRFARRAVGRAFTLCGVPEYLAPEVVGGTGHDESADLWALGVLIYHLITGGTPFAQLGDDELRIYRRILRAAPRWPDTPAGHEVSADARDVVAQLLRRDPATRLGVVRARAPRRAARRAAPAAAAAPPTPRRRQNTCRRRLAPPPPQGKGGIARLRAHPWFRSIHWDDLEEGRTMVPLGLRERLFHSAGGGELGPWAPAARAPGATDPAWLEEF
ncbi:protein phosphatase 2C [Scenedesmus sp. PABB004]|nr:protein phosphatase 2C [Scenedesmus sp. PABB004]